MPRGILKLISYGNDVAALFVSVIDYFTDEGKPVCHEAVLIRKDDFMTCASVFASVRDTRIVRLSNGDAYAIDSLESCFV